jgi:hypothetical protein
MECRKMTPHELAQRTIRDIAKKRQLENEGKKQAFMNSMDNINRIKRRILHCK